VAESFKTAPAMKEGAVPGNPLECRLHALRCSQLAETAATPELQRTFLTLEETWRILAAELASDQVFLKTMSELEFRRPSQPCEPYEALPSALKLRSWAA
jgi:hypothetical protein